jgi:hypothetical protein
MPTGFYSYIFDILGNKPLPLQAASQVVETDCKYAGFSLNSKKFKFKANLGVLS